MEGRQREPARCHSAVVNRPEETVRQEVLASGETGNRLLNVKPVCGAGG